MADSKCNTCGKEINSGSGKCLHCNPTQATLFLKVIVGLLLLIAGFFAWNHYQQPISSNLGATQQAGKISTTVTNNEPAKLVVENNSANKLTLQNACITSIKKTLGKIKNVGITNADQWYTELLTDGSIKFQPSASVKKSTAKDKAQGWAWDCVATMNGDTANVLSLIKVSGN